VDRRPPLAILGSKRCNIVVAIFTIRSRWIGVLVIEGSRGRLRGCVSRDEQRRDSFTISTYDWQNIESSVVEYFNSAFAPSSLSTYSSNGNDEREGDIGATVSGEEPRDVGEETTEKEQKPENLGPI
jgi:hypothetical protein